MGAFAQVWGSLLPLRWYMQILFDQAARGVPLADSVRAVPDPRRPGARLLRARLVAAARHRPASRPTRGGRPRSADRTGAAASAAPSPRNSAACSRDRGAFGLIVLAPLIYGVLYPQPYLGQLIRGIPIAVVDDDRTELSRDARPDLECPRGDRGRGAADTLAEAQAALDRREVFAILGIPAGTEREVLKGDKARLPAYVDSAYFLLYNRTLQGISEAAATVTADIAARGARPDGSLVSRALAAEPRRSSS